MNDRDLEIRITAWMLRVRARLEAQGEPRNERGLCFVGHGHEKRCCWRSYCMVCSRPVYDTIGFAKNVRDEAVCCGLRCAVRFVQVQLEELG